MLRNLIIICILSGVFGVLFLRHTPELTFVEGIVGQPINFNPTSGPQNEIDETIEALLFRSLFKYGAAERLVNDLAESYKVGRGEKVYEVKIKEDIFWHDGVPIGAEDVKTTFSQDPTFTEAKIEVVTDKLIRFKLGNPLSSFLSLLTKPIAPSHLKGIDQPFVVMGSGDFKVQQVKRDGIVSEVVLQKISEGGVEKIIFKFFQTESEMKEAAKRGEIDAFAADSFTHPSFTKYTTPLCGQYFAIFFNLTAQNKLVRKRIFRKAAAHKIPINTLINDVLGGEGKPVRGPMSGTWAEAKLSFSRFLPKLKGSYGGKLVLKVPKSAALPKLAEQIAQGWRELGVRVVVFPITPMEIDETVSNRDFEAIILGQEVGRDPDRYSLWHSTQKDYPGVNISSYADPRADRALEEGRKTNRRVARKHHYLNFQRVFLEDTPAVFLYHPNFNYFVSQRFTGVDLSPIFLSSERFWNILKWERLR